MFISFNIARWNDIDKSANNNNVHHSSNNSSNAGKIANMFNVTLYINAIFQQGSI